MYALLFVMAMALTGLTWSFDWYRSAFYSICGVEHTPRSYAGNDNKFNAENKTHKHNENRPGTHRRHDRHSKGHDDGREGRRHSEFGRWQQIYDKLKAQNPDAPQITVGPETASVSLGISGNTRASDRYEYNRHSGEITSVMKYAESVPADKLRGWIYSIHTGSLGGIITRILWFLGALLGASLPLTGYYIWIKRLSKKKHVH